MDSPVCTGDFTWNELDAVITPFGKGENSLSSGFGSTEDITVNIIMQHNITLIMDICENSLVENINK